MERPHFRSAAANTKPEGEESLSFPFLRKSSRNISDVVTVIISSRHHQGGENVIEKLGKNNPGSFFSRVVSGSGEIKVPLDLGGDIFSF